MTKQPVVTTQMQDDADTTGMTSRLTPAQEAANLREVQNYGAPKHTHQATAPHHAPPAPTRTAFAAVESLLPPDFGKKPVLAPAPRPATATQTNPINGILDGIDRQAAREAMTPLERSVEAVSYSIKGEVFGNPSDFNQRVTSGNLTEQQLAAFDKGGQRLIAEMANNPAFMRALGAHPAEKGNPQSQGALDLNGDGMSSTAERAALAAAIDERRTHGESIEQVTSALGSKSFRDRAAQIAQAIDPTNAPQQLADLTQHELPCKPVAIRIIPCDKGFNR